MIFFSLFIFYLWDYLKFSSTQTVIFNNAFRYLQKKEKNFKDESSTMLWLVDNFFIFLFFKKWKPVINLI